MLSRVTDVIQARYLRLIFDLLEAGATTVVYEAASSLTSLTNNPVAVKAAATKFVELSVKEADNNVKLIVLDRVDQLRRRNEGVLDELTMEILRVLASPDMDVRRKALNLALEMVSSKNVDEVVMLLKKELQKTVDEQYEKVRNLDIVPFSTCEADFENRKTFMSLRLSHSSNHCLSENKADYGYSEHRISTTTYSLYTSVRHQILRSCGVRCGSSNVRIFKNDAFLFGTKPESRDEIRESGLLFSLRICFHAQIQPLRSNADSTSGISSQTLMRLVPST